MGFLHKLWDETLAGPMPESGLGKLRKYDSFSGATGAPRSSPEPVFPHHNEDLPITRSITILRTNSNNFKNISLDPGSAPDSPCTPRTPSTPRNPFSPGTPSGEFKRLTRRKSSMDAFGPR